MNIFEVSIYSVIPVITYMALFPLAADAFHNSAIFAADAFHSSAIFAADAFHSSAIFAEVNLLFFLRCSFLNQLNIFSLDTRFD